MTSLVAQIAGIREPPFSPNARVILDRAVALARERHHENVGTEHLVYAICESPGRSIGWIARTTFGDSTGSTPELIKSITDFLESRPMFQRQSECGGPDPVFSNALTRAILIAKQIGSGPVRDGEEIYHDGLVASEFLLAGVLVEGTGLGAEALSRRSRGRVNSFSLLEAIGVNIDAILLPKLSRDTWKEHVVEPETTAVRTRRDMGRCEADSLDEIAALLPESPTANSNWLVSGKLIIGEHPAASDAVKLKDAGVNTFVSLIGEYNFDTFKSKYPSAVAAIASELVEPVHFIHFPIRDFDVVDAQLVRRLVLELKKRINQRGETVFVHCRGGHGLVFMHAISFTSI